MNGFWEEVGKGKGIAGIALDDGTFASAGGCKGRRLAVEAQVYPTRQEARPGKKESRVSAEYGAGKGVEQDKDGREMLDAHTDGTLEDGDGVLGHELFEGDEKGGFEGESAMDDCVSVAQVRSGRAMVMLSASSGLLDLHSHLVPTKSVPQRVDDKGYQIGDDGDKEDKLGKLAASPGALKVSASIEDGQGGGGKAEDVLLNQGRGEEDVGISQRRGGHDGEEGDADGAPSGTRVHGGRPLSISQRGIEESEGEQTKQKRACQWGDVYSKRHLVGSI